MDSREGLFWIDDESVSSGIRKDGGGGNPIVRTEEQRRSVSDSMNLIRESNSFEWYGCGHRYERPENFIFRVKVNDDRKLRHSDAIDNNAISLNYVFNEREAVVSNTCDAFYTMERKAEVYADSGRNKTRFDDFDELSPNTGEWKLSKELAEGIDKDRGTRIVRLQIVPGIKDRDTVRWMDGIQDAISTHGGSVLGTRIAGGMTFVYAETDPETIRILGECPAVLSMTTPATASVDEVSPLVIDGSHYTLDPSVDIRSKRTVAVLDNGDNLPPALSDVVVEHLVAPGMDASRGVHGTMVASRLAFGTIGNDTDVNILRPRCAIVDYKIIEDREDCGVLSDRIREAVETLHDRCNLFVLCVNVETPFMGEDNEISLAIDEMHSKYGVRFFVPAGNHGLWKVETDLESIIDDSDSGIAAPGDAISAVTVGAAVGVDHPESMSVADQPAPYSRFGPGPLGCVKPNITGLSGTVLPDGTVPIDSYSSVLSPHGLTTKAGTSFSTPHAAGLLVSMGDIVGDSSNLMALALTYHYARVPNWRPRNIRVDVRNMYGFGIVDDSLLAIDPRREAILMRQSSIRAGDDEILSIPLPEHIEGLIGRNHNLRVRVTCLADAVIDRSRGADMVRSTVNFSKKGFKGDNTDNGNSVFWDVCTRRTYEPTSLEEGGLCITLRGYGKDEMKDKEVRYALVVSLEDLSGTVDVSAAIRNDGCYPLLGSVDSRLKSRAESVSSVDTRTLIRGL